MESAGVIHCDLKPENILLWCVKSRGRCACLYINIRRVIYMFKKPPKKRPPSQNRTYSSASQQAKVQAKSSGKGCASDGGGNNGGSKLQQNQVKVRGGHRPLVVDKADYTHTRDASTPDGWIDGTTRSSHHTPSKNQNDCLKPLPP